MELDKLIRVESDSFSQLQNFKESLRDAEKFLKTTKDHWSHKKAEIDYDDSAEKRQIKNCEHNVKELKQAVRKAQDSYDKARAASADYIKKKLL